MILDGGSVLLSCQGPAAETKWGRSVDGMPGWQGAECTRRGCGSQAPSEG